MPIEITWMIPQRILLAEGREPISEQDMQVFVEELSIILDAATGLVHTVMDLSDVKTITESFPYIYYGSRIPAHPRRGRTGLVKANFQARVQADILNRISGCELFHLFDSREAARTFLLVHDSPPAAFTTRFEDASQESSESSSPDAPSSDEATAGNGHAR